MSTGLQAVVVPRPVSMRLGAFVELAEVLVAALSHRVPVKRKPTWEQKMGAKLRRKPGALQYLERYIEDEYGSEELRELRAEERRKKRVWVKQMSPDDWVEVAGFC